MKLYPKKTTMATKLVKINGYLQQLNLRYSESVKRIIQSISLTATHFICKIKQISWKNWKYFLYFYYHYWSSTKSNFRHASAESIWWPSKINLIACWSTSRVIFLCCRCLLMTQFRALKSHERERRLTVSFLEIIFSTNFSFGMCIAWLAVALSCWNYMLWGREYLDLFKQVAFTVTELEEMEGPMIS